jgi:phosphohistidine swiveling domain-containing protein
MKKLTSQDYITKSFDASNAFFSIQMDSLRILERVFGEKVWENDFYFIKDGHSKCLIPKPDLEKIRGLFEKKLREYPDFFNDLYESNERKFVKFREDYVHYLDEIDTYSDSDSLREWIRNFQATSQDITGEAYITDGIGLDYEAWMPFLPITKDEFIETVIPLRPSFTKEFERHLAELKLADSPDLDAFIKSYSWIENSYATIDRFDKSRLMERLKTLSHDEAEKIVSEKVEDLTAEHREQLRSKGFDDYQLSIAISLSRAIDLHDLRKEAVYRINSILNKAYRKLLSLYDFAQEDVEIVIKGSHFAWIPELSPDELLEKSKQALTGFAWFVNGDIYFGDDASAMLPEDSSDSNITEIKGFTACKGQATGKVVVVIENADHKKVSDGCILVTTMTRPEMIPIMQKAVAFVTDDGGITCHAAIVAREMKKPCIIGTKIATKILKDGDMIEVDADTGIIRKL